MKTRIYLDTSVPSAFYDTSKPVRQLMTQKWFENDSHDYELVTSIVTINEINEIKNVNKLKNIQDLILDYNVNILELSDKAIELAEEYIRLGAIPKSEKEDAWHIAIATVNQIESLVSWNFKHIVNINPIRKIHQINISHGYLSIDIGSIEIFGGYKYGNI